MDILFRDRYEKCELVLKAGICSLYLLLETYVKRKAQNSITGNPICTSGRHLVFVDINGTSVCVVNALWLVLPMTFTAHV